VGAIKAIVSSYQLLGVVNAGVVQTAPKARGNTAWDEMEGVQSNRRGWVPAGGGLQQQASGMGRGAQAKLTSTTGCGHSVGQDMPLLVLALQLDTCSSVLYCVAVSA
jgi:hypothetical protein